MASISVHVERIGDQFTLTAIIPPRYRSVGANFAAMQRALTLLMELNPDATDPGPSYEEHAVAHHATEAPMPPAVEELIARSEDDDGPDGLKAGEAYRDHGDGTP